jgi:hypothetical protein
MGGNKMNKPTPETDAETIYCDAMPNMPWVDADICRKLERERDEARESFKIVYNERVQMELERNEWKNKAYSNATDYTLMEAKCFRLEQQLKEYDKLKS